MRKFIKYIIVFIFFLTSSVCAQQLPQLTSYELNPFLYNPAFAGVNEYTEVNAVIREQWSGIEGAPETKVLSAYGLLRNAKMGLGGSVYSDKIGAESKNGFQLSYAYHINLKENLKLSLGLSAGLMQYKIDNTNINAYDSNDPIFSLPAIDDVVPNASFGAFIYSENYYLSLAMPQLLNSSFSAYDVLDEDEETNLIQNSKLESHYYFSAGYKYKINEVFTVQPSVLVKMIANQIQYQATSKLTYKDMIWVAPSYRLDDAAIMFIGYDINDQFYIAYGHEFTTSELGSVSSGTHELKLGVRFIK